MPQLYPAGTVFDPETGLAVAPPVARGEASPREGVGLRGGPTEHSVTAGDAGPGKVLVHSSPACGPGERPVIRCGNCGGPNASAERCAWCGLDFTA